LAGLRVFALYNFNTESRWLPALSLRTDVGLPVGSLAGDGARVAAKVVATRSWGRTRAHVNLARGFGSEDALAMAEPLARWNASLAVDRTFFRSSMLLIGEIATAETARGTPASVNASLGGRWQWTPTLVLFAGISRRLRTGRGPDFGLTLGLAHAFAVRALMPAEARSRR
jgi:hypothetical protein